MTLIGCLSDALLVVLLSDWLDVDYLCSHLNRLVRTINTEILPCIAEKC